MAVTLNNEEYDFTDAIDPFEKEDEEYDFTDAVDPDKKEYDFTGAIDPFENDDDIEEVVQSSIQEQTDAALTEETVIT